MIINNSGLSGVATQAKVGELQVQTEGHATQLSNLIAQVTNHSTQIAGVINTNTTQQTNIEKNSSNINTNTQMISNIGTSFIINFVFSNGNPESGSFKWDGIVNSTKYYLTTQPILLQSKNDKAFLVSPNNDESKDIYEDIESVETIDNTIRILFDKQYTSGSLSLKFTSLGDQFALNNNQTEVTLS